MNQTATSPLGATDVGAPRLYKHDGRTLGLTEWARRTKINRQTLAGRLYSGWSVARTLTTPPLQHPDLTGQRFGTLQVLFRRPNGRNAVAVWSCRCSTAHGGCGHTHAVPGTQLLRGQKSCGCLVSRQISVARQTHCSTGTPEWWAWRNVVRKAPREDVDPRWLPSPDGFGEFFDDLGPRPTPQHRLVRLDLGRGYRGDNVAWLTPTQQGGHGRRTTRWLTHGGRTLSMKAWALEVGLKPVTVAARLRRGWSVARALTEPVR